MNIPKTYLTEAYAVDTQVILSILTQNKPANKEDPKYSYYTKLANWVNSDHKQQKLKNIELNNIKLTDRGLIEKRKLVNKYSTLGHLLLALKNLMDQEGKYNPKNELSKLIQQTTLEILAGLSGIKDVDEQTAEPDDEDSSDETAVRKGKDWTAYKAKKLASDKPTSKALEEFYDEYYSVEYADVESPDADTRGIVAKLKSLDKILIPEFNKLGYNPEVNPFASFLKILIKEKFDIFKKLTFNTYGAIHNSFIEEHITGNMLGQKFDKTNILFCNDLYSKDGLSIVEYLSLQKQARNAQEKSEYASDANLIAKIFIRQPDESENFTEKVKALLAAKDAIVPGNKDAKLRSILEIRDLYRDIFKAEAEQPKTKVDNKTVANIIKEAEQKNVILDMIELILDQKEYAGSTKYSEEAQKIETWLEARNHTSTRKAKVDSKKILLNYSLNADALSLIIKNLKHHIDEPTETQN